MNPNYSGRLEAFVFSLS